MSLLSTLADRWEGVGGPLLLNSNGSLRMAEILEQNSSHLDRIKPGEVVALIGGFDAQSIKDLLVLIDRGAILVPLTTSNRSNHEYFFEAALVDWIVENQNAHRRIHHENHLLLRDLRLLNHAGLILFTSGTTGRPKAILHDMTIFLKRFEEPRPALRTMAFLMFDHIGGINTLLHTMFNAGVVITPPDGRSVDAVLATCQKHKVEALPATPTFLRMMLISGLVPDNVPSCLRIITYGTERMDQPTLDALCELLPNVDFRQTYGMSELGILRAKSRARNSLFMRIGGHGVETRVEHGLLKILSPNRMLGYLNADTPFDSDGWYDTGDIVEIDEEFLKIVGRTTEVINVGGLKFMASEVERAALEFPGVVLVSATPKPNPLTGQHVEMLVEAAGTLNTDEMRDFLRERLPSHMVPSRITNSKVAVSHRFKRN